MSPMTPPQALRLALIDFDGTLCDTHDAVLHVIALTFRSFGREPAPADAVDAAIRSGVVVSELFNRLLGHEPGAAPGQQWALRYREIYDSGEGLARTALFPGVREGLDALLAAGWRCGVVSNKGVVALHAALARFGIEDRFAFVVGNAAGLRRKPDPELYRETVLPLAGAAPRRCLMIGDTATDLAFARAIGAEGCWAEYGFGDREQCLALRPEHRLLRFDAVAALAEGREIVSA